MCTQKWTYDPIWQYRGGKKNETLDGCEVHAKLAKQLYAEHEDAILHLRNFRETIANNAKLNPDPNAVYPMKRGTDERYTARELADWWMAWAANMELRIYDPDTDTGCSVP